MRMRPLSGPDGQAALVALMRCRRPLLAFDFDGTLAPIVARPDQAQIPADVAVRLAALAGLGPTAVITGRAVADVRARLGVFSPGFVVGHHGAHEEGDEAGVQALRSALDPLRAAIAAHHGALDAAGVTVEDKRLSIAFHYRLAADAVQALGCIRCVLAAAPPGLHTFDGKCVVNAVGAGAPDKAHALHRLLTRCGADGVLFAGDDLNDEPVFDAAAPGWVTVRIGSDEGGPASRARWFIEGTHQMVLLLDRLLALRAAG